LSRKRKTGLALLNPRGARAALVPPSAPAARVRPAAPAAVDLLAALTVLAAVALLAALTLASCGGSRGDALQRVKSSGVLRVGTDATYPPFETIDPETGQLAGFDVDLVRALAARLGARAEFVVVPFDGIIPGLKSGKYDLVVSAMTITPERARQVRFTRPYVIAGQSVATRADDASISGAKDLAGRKVGCQLGTTGELEAKKITNAQVVSFDAIGSAFRDLENGNLDAVIADTPTARIFIRDHPGIRLAGDPLTREEFGMAVRPQDAPLAEALDQGLEALRQGGEVARVEAKWGVSSGP